MSCEKISSFQENNTVPSFHTEHSFELEERINNVLWESPICGLLYKNNQPTTFFAKSIQKIDTACLQQQVYDHGFNHIFSVIKNTLVLADIVNNGIYKNGETILEKDTFCSTYSDAMLAFPVFVHDIGTGLKNIQWKNKHAIDHEKKGADFLEYVKARKLHRIIDKSDKKTEESILMLEQLSPLYLQTIKSNTKDVIAYAQSLTSYQKLAPEQLFPIVVMLGDKFDYYRSKRMSNSKDLYFPSAEAVDFYSISSNEDTLTFNLTLKNMNFGDWYTETQELYGEVWVLASAFAQLIDKKFKVQEVIPNSTQNATLHQ